MMWKGGVLAFIVITAVVSADNHEKRHKKGKESLEKHHKKAHINWDKKDAVERQAKEDLEAEDIFKMMEDDEDDIFKMMEDDDIEDDAEDSPNPCDALHCGPGRACSVDDNDVATCACVDECGEEMDTRRMACTNHNTTHNSHCSVYRERCLCEENDPRCQDPKNKHIHVEYFGECRVMAECTVDDLVDFPRRMREWLFNVMKELADRKELSKYYQEVEKEAEEDSVELRSKRWTNSAVWKWCDLDSHPHDNAVSRHELFPLKAPLHALEHCMSPFLDKCDSDQDHSITLKEWATCLELEEADLVVKCEKLDL